jgi:hypothetical protein
MTSTLTDQEKLSAVTQFEDFLSEHCPELLLEDMEYLLADCWEGHVDESKYMRVSLWQADEFSAEDLVRDPNPEEMSRDLTQEDVDLLNKKYEDFAVLMRRFYGDSATIEIGRSYWENCGTREVFAVPNEITVYFT